MRVYPEASSGDRRSTLIERLVVNEVSMSSQNRVVPEFRISLYSPRFQASRNASANAGFL